MISGLYVIKRIILNTINILVFILDPCSGESGIYFYLLSFASLYVLLMVMVAEALKY